MRPRKIFGLLIPLLQLLLILKLIELIQGLSIKQVEYVTSIPYNNNNPSADILKSFKSNVISGREFITRKKRKHYIPYWTTTEDPKQTTIFIEEIIKYNKNGNEIDRHNVTISKKISNIIVPDSNNPKPLCPIQEEQTSRQQIVRQSTLPMLILFINVAVWVVGLMIFLLLWKVNYYTVSDGYATGVPEDTAQIQRSLESYSSDPNSLRNMTANNNNRKKNLTNHSYDYIWSLLNLCLEKLERALII